MNNIVPEGFGSTYLSPRINNYADLVYRTKQLLGFPVQNDELTDTQWATIIDEALENYTSQGAGAKEEYLIFCANKYIAGCGVKLDDLVNIGCNAQFCNQTCVVSAVTSLVTTFDLIDTKSAYLSVTPFSYPTTLDVSNPYSVAYSAISGQYMYLYFDPKNPWNANTVCNLDCVQLNPINSAWYKLSANPNLSGISFDFVDDNTLTPLLSSLSGNLPMPWNAVPLTAMGNLLTAVPISYYDVSAFYPSNLLFGPPLEACINIGGGSGYIVPKCDTSLINACSALSAQYGISPNYPYVITTETISSVEVSTTAIEFPTISAFFANFCDACNCNCNSLSSFNEATSSVNFTLFKNIISGGDGSIWDLSATDISKATFVKFNNVPICVGDDAIALNYNNGIIGTFTLCNSALNTNGNMYLESVQFLKDYKPDVNALYNTQCGWNNNGFTLNHYISSNDSCLRHTPDKVPVDISFYKKNEFTQVGEVTSYYSSNFDYGLQRRRKVYDVFSFDNANNTGSYGGYGSDLLFNFDYALLASTFGYNMQGSRINAGLGYDLVTYHLARSFVEQSKKMLRYISYTFDPHTQYLKMTPEPPRALQGCPGGNCSNVATSMDAIIGGYSSQCYLVGVYIEAPVHELLATYFVREYTLARAMQVIGNIRSKYGNVTLYGGASLDGSSLIERGTARIETLMKELRNENYWVAPPMLFIS